MGPEAGKDGVCKRGIAGQGGGSTLAGESWREVGSRELGRGRSHHPLRLGVCLAKGFLIPGLCLDKQEGLRESQTERERKKASTRSGCQALPWPLCPID